MDHNPSYKFKSELAMSDFALPKARLVDFLKKKRPDLHAKANELRKAVERWLTYIPATYPHFTEHTVNHSDEIIKQASNLLFENEGPAKPVLKHLSGSEAYLLIASAYLHDVGMVVSDADKVRILESQEWKDWTTDGDGAKRHEEIQQLREEKGTNADVRHFRADVQMRYLMADFLRRSHHIRSAELILPDKEGLGRFGFDDPVAVHTISNICAGHGLHHHDLEDAKRFPDDKDVLGQAVNVRLIAILLRLGDLLDLRHDRACPLLMNAASPLPAGSVAHWTQYQCFTDLTTRPRKVRIAAECRTLDEHRVIRDWCQWIVDEVRNARTLAARFERHKSWHPPDATIDGPTSTISIERAAGAKYIWSDWKFELDHAGVIERLTHDLYESPNDYIRELLQNAFDATRCKMYADLKATGQTPPEYPTEVEEEVREKYPISISLEERQRTNENTGETETRQYLIVEDRGIGMDREIIERYFLQISRSYYVTPEFRREFGFVPASRFGVGFLSVFAVSDNIVVDTFKPSSDKPEAIRLTLTGPRNYLLTEQSERKGSGTRIEVELRKPLAGGLLASLVGDWCVRVEFPILIDDLGTHFSVVSRSPDTVTFDLADIGEPGRRIVLKPFPIDIPGIDGHFYVQARTFPDSDDWEILSLSRDRYLELHPAADLPDIRDSIMAICGVAVCRTRSYRNQDFAIVDFRDASVLPTISRKSIQESWDRDVWWKFSDRLRQRFVDVLFQHMKLCPHRGTAKHWKYIQSFGSNNYPSEFLFSVPDAVRLNLGGKREYLSVEGTRGIARILLILSIRDQRFVIPERGMKWSEAKEHVPKSAYWLTLKDLDEADTTLANEFLWKRHISSISWLSDEVVCIALGIGKAASNANKRIGVFQLVDIGAPSVVGLSMIPAGAMHGFYALNSRHDFVAWIQEITKAGADPSSSVEPNKVRTTLDLLGKYMSGYQVNVTIEHVNRFVHGWTELESLPKDLHPPDITLTDDMFLIKPGDEMPPLPDDIVE